MHCPRRRTESRLQSTRTENFVKFGHVVFMKHASRQTNTQTDVQTH